MSCVHQFPDSRCLCGASLLAEYRRLDMAIRTAVGHLVQGSMKDAEKVLREASIPEYPARRKQTTVIPIRSKIKK